MKYCKCVAYDIAKEWGGDTGECNIVKANFKCKLCKDDEKLYRKHMGGDFKGSSFECNKCGKYVKYYLSIRVYKEEFYLFNDNRGGVIIFDYETKTCDVINDETTNTIPIFKFENVEQCLNKIKTYNLFF